MEARGAGTMMTSTPMNPSTVIAQKAPARVPRAVQGTYGDHDRAGERIAVTVYKEAPATRR